MDEPAPAVLFEGVWTIEGGRNSKDEHIAACSDGDLAKLQKHGRGGEAHITVHASPQAMLGEIFYSFAPHALTNTSNGGFSIDADDYHLFLRPTMFYDDNRNRTWSPQEAAGRLWQDFLEQAGITHG